MFPHLQIPGHGSSSPDARRVPPGLPENHSVNRPTSFSPSPSPEPHSGEPRRPPIRLPTKRIQQPAEPWKADVVRIAELPPLLDLSYDDYDADDESNDSSHLGGAEGKLPISLEQTEFSLRQFAKRMGQANYSVFNKWKKVWVAGFLQKKHRSSICRQNHLKRVWAGPLHWDMAIAHFFETFETRLLLDNIDNAECNRWQCVEIFLKKCASKIQEARKEGMQCNMRPVTDLGRCASYKARSNLLKLPKTTFMVVTHCVLIGTDLVLAPRQLQVSYTKVRNWEELTDFINKNGGPKGPYILTLMCKRTMEQDKLDEKYIGLYTNGQMIMDPIYSQMSYNCCRSNAFYLKHRHNPKIFLVDIKRAAQKEIDEHVLRPAKVFPPSNVKVWCVHLLIMIPRLWKVLKSVEERIERRMVGKRMIHLLM